ncbi:MAG: DinB family protein [Eudoraea sp.]|nr:DinB family protein [Eudoraea sp.]MBT8322029.1 DinB family protein [Eudoraea sp.]NNJ40242.1 DinB family protein [Eudoraea sp.]
MIPTAIVKELSRNRQIFKELLSSLEEEMYVWKTGPEKWCLLEVVCHLYDEEREDFRARTKHVLETPDEPIPLFDQLSWVIDREYMRQDFAEKLEAFLKERKQSITWLESLQAPKWENAYDHPKLGPMTARMFLTNWLAHDYFHIRQIIKIKFGYLQQQTREDLSYAGDW